MQQFRRIPSFVGVDNPEDQAMVSMVATSSDDSQSESASIPQPVLSGPLFFLTSTSQERRTDEYAVVSGSLPLETGTLSLISALQSTMTVDTGERERIVLIPAEKKRATITEPLTARRRMSLRMRHGLVAVVVFLVLVTTLLSLTPLATGQGGLQLFGEFGSWVGQQAFNWSIQSHDAPVVQQPVTSVSNSNSNPPPMTLPKSQYIAIAQQDATAAGISPVYFVRQINQESGFNPYAISPAGAEGIAQFEPYTASGLGINPWNPIQSLQAAAQLMARYNQNYGGDYAKALAAYNGGPGTVTYAVNTCGAANWLNCLPGETRNYIYVIMGI